MSQRANERGGGSKLACAVAAEEWEGSKLGGTLYIAAGRQNTRKLTILMPGCIKQAGWQQTSLGRGGAVRVGGGVQHECESRRACTGQRQHFSSRQSGIMDSAGPGLAARSVHLFGGGAGWGEG